MGSLIKPGCSFVSNSAEESFSLGEKIAGYLKHSRLTDKGCVIALVWELGSGKTCLTKGIAGALGIKENITSPTYTIINEYNYTFNNTIYTLYHIDAYRLSSSEDFEQIGGGEIVNSPDLPNGQGLGISIIEWGGRILQSLPDDKITITFKITGQTSRNIQIGGIEI